MATAVHATRCAVTQALGTSPGNLVFRRDMFIDLPLIANLVDIQQRRQLKIDENLLKQNQKRREFNYQVGQQVYVKVINPTKLSKRVEGPYNIVQVYTNGTVDVARNAHVTERVNIRRLTPRLHT